MGKIPLRTIDETYESPLKIGGKAIVTRLLGSIVLIEGNILLQSF